ncbi:lipoamide acyltransferase component of branched-chain alpha-keto acid dehydrogenase complex, mitochondrial [Anthonomus grandis grandis]|uniref:lipoamide acyltransferase component of branched-chain alpha-keto acid dehydrogenase complex, mitochondrial n=1 Tax=Anthonomus grandis grandis TaxID=2921223 RepID=UPI002166069F|nr:lipoamide acyltransferase component of branched-chain alpha-keto acid dehydrogenase complex, mitochondrial [Anthonomus grandis grandis]
MFFVKGLGNFKHLNVAVKDMLSKNGLVRTLVTSSILAKKVSFNLSDIGEGIREVVVKDWFVKPGDKVSQFDNICEVQSDKASVTITSRYDGVITKLYYQVDDVALVGQPLIDLETDENSDTNDAPTPQSNPLSVQSSNKTEEPPTAFNHEKEKEPAETSALADDTSSVFCIPSVRRFAKEHKLDLSKIKGSGKGQRILKEDLLKYIEISSTEKNQEIRTHLQPVFLNQDDIKVEPIKGFTKAMVKTMTEALKIPHFGYSDEIRVTKLSKLRKELKQLPDLDVKITFLPFFIKAASNALKRYPIINSSLDGKCENIIYKKHHNIGIAMDTNQGLAVPVIKNVAELTIIDIAQEITRLIASGRSGNFAPSDLSGATFSISNIGIIGGTYTKPVILPPQVAIVAIGKTHVVPRFDDAGNIIREEIINISGSADHRIIDGVTMANFITTLRKQLENPNLLFLNL